MNLSILIVAVIIVVVLIGSIILALVGNHSRVKANQGQPVFVTEEAAILARDATVVQTSSSIQQLGAVQTPNHRVVFSVEFALDAGGRVVLEVPEENFDAFYKGQHASLVTQGDFFVGFGDIGSTS